MQPLPVLVDLTSDNLATLRCCGVSNPKHDGRCRKERWMRAHFPMGVKAKVLLAPDGRQCGYIEYLPGEYAWRGVEAPGYMFIHCIWTFFRQYQGKGWAKKMVQACLDDARQAGMAGVAVLCRKGPWLAESRLFLSAGFRIVDTAPPDYELLVSKFDPTAPDPSLREDGAGKLKRYAHGLTIIRSDQCPHIAKFAGDIAETAEREYGLKPRVVELKSHRAAQNAPTPYAIFSIVLDGRLLADHQISRTRFRNIMRRLSKAG